MTELPKDDRLEEAMPRGSASSFASGPSLLIPGLDPFFHAVLTGDATLDTKAVSTAALTAATLGRDLVLLRSLGFVRRNQTASGRRRDLLAAEEAEARKPKRVFTAVCKLLHLNPVPYCDWYQHPGVVLSLEVLAATAPLSQLLFYGIGTGWMLRWTIPFALFSLFNAPMLLHRAHDTWDLSRGAHRVAFVGMIVATPLGIALYVAAAIAKLEHLPFQSHLIYVLVVYASVRPVKAEPAFCVLITSADVQIAQPAGPRNGRAHKEHSF